MTLEDDKKESPWTIEHLFGIDSGPAVQVPQNQVPQSKPVPGAKDNLQKQFELFHKQNPHVLDTIIRIAAHLKDEKNFRRCGMRLIFNHLRWLYAIKTEGDEYKINNNHSPYYARTIMALRKDMEGFFSVRKTNMSFVPDWDALGIDPKDPKWPTI